MYSTRRVLSKDLLDQLLTRYKDVGVKPEKAYYSKYKFKPKMPKFSSESVVFSAIKPTGVPHLGNYFGVLKNWVEIQKETESYPGMKAFYMLADLHAISTPSKETSKSLPNHVLDLAASLLALGVDHDKVALFRQSAVPEHTQLSWHLSCLSSYKELTKLPLWIQKHSQPSEGITELSSLSYPILQAADMLLYRASHVPIGLDQRSNVKFARLLAKEFNELYSSDLMRTPQAIYTSSPCIYSLKNPVVKMTESDPFPHAIIWLNSSPDEMKTKIRRAMTDSFDHISFCPETRPGVSNLVTLMSLISGKTLYDVADDYKFKQKIDLKDDLTEALVAHLKPFQESFSSIRRNEDFLRLILLQGAEKAREEASTNLKKIQSHLGLNSIELIK